MSVRQRFIYIDETSFIIIGVDCNFFSADGENVMISRLYGISFAALIVAIISSFVKIMV